MPLTRRAFTAGATASIALTVLGCGKEEAASGSGAAQPSPNRPSAKLTTEPFTAGTVADYTAEGVYDTHAQDKGVFLVSDGTKLVALSGECTHNGCGTAWDGSVFKCPCHGSEFEKDGTNKPNMKAHMPLVALAITADDAGQITVDPTQKFSEAHGNADDAAASLPLS